MCEVSVRSDYLFYVTVLFSARLIVVNAPVFFVSSLAEATLCVPRRLPWEQFSPPRKNCHDFTLAWSGARRAPLPATRTSWQVLRGGKTCCHCDCLGTQGFGSTSEHHNVFFAKLDTSASTHPKPAEQSNYGHVCRKLN